MSEKVVALVGRKRTEKNHIYRSILSFSLFFICFGKFPYRNQAEVAHTCRGTISLHGALIHTVDSCTFVISNGGTQTFHIKGNF